MPVTYDADTGIWHAGPKGRVIITRTGSRFKVTVETTDHKASVVTYYRSLDTTMKKAEEFAYRLLGKRPPTFAMDVPDESPSLTRAARPMTKVQQRSLSQAYQKGLGKPYSKGYVDQQVEKHRKARA